MASYREAEAREMLRRISMRSKPEIVRIMQNMIDEAEENIIRAEGEWSAMHRATSKNIERRRDDLNEAIDLVNELQEEDDGISAGSSRDSAQSAQV